MHRKLGPSRVRKEGCLEMIRRVQKQEKRGLQATKMSQRLQSPQALNAIVLQIQKLHLLHRQHNNNILAHQKGVSFCWRRISSAKTTMDPRFLSFFPYITTTTSRLWKQIIVHNVTNSSCSYVHLSLQDHASKQKKKKKKLLPPLDMAKTSANFCEEKRQRQREDCQKRHCLQYIPPDFQWRWIPGCEGRADHSMRESDTICFVCIVCVSIPWSSPMPSSSSSSTRTPLCVQQQQQQQQFFLVVAVPVLLFLILLLLLLLTTQEEAAAAATEECEITGSKHRREKSDNDDERRIRTKEEEGEKRQLECSWCRLWMTERKKRLQRGRSSVFYFSLSLAHRIAGGSIFCWTLFQSVCVERVFLLLHRLVFSADLVSCNSRSSVQLKDAAEKVGRETLDLLLLLRRGLLLLLLSAFGLLQYRSTVAGALREIFFFFCDDDKVVLFYQKPKCVFPYFWFFFANLETSAIMHLTNKWGCEWDNSRCITRTMLWLLFGKKKKKTASGFAGTTKRKVPILDFKRAWFLLPSLLFSILMQKHMTHSCCKDLVDR